MKRLTTLIIITNLFCLGELQAQFSVDWAFDYRHTNAANFSNEGRKVAIDSTNGQIYTLSDVTSDLDPSGTITGQTYSYTVLSQFDASGNLMESVDINVGTHFGSGYDLKSGFGLQVDASGNIYIGYMNFDATTNYDVNIAKFDSQLNQLWNYKFNAATEDVGIAMEVSNIGNAFAILRSTSGIAIRHRIIKANAAGTSAVALYTYSAQPDFLADLAVDANQKVYTTGYRLLSGVKSILMSCVSGTGTLLWSRADNCGSVTGDDFSRDINLGNDGYLYITGSSQGTVQHGIDAAIMKFNPVNGKKMWETFINVNLNDGGYFVVNPDPNYVFASWVAGSTVYIDQISAFTGLQIRRINYTPAPVSPFSSLGQATISDMKISKHQGIYLTGGISGISGGQNFSACYLIKANFAGRGLPAVEYTFPVTGQPSGSFKGNSIALNENNTHVYFLQDETDTYTSHLQETVWLVSVDVAGSFLRNQNSGINSENSSLKIETQPNPVGNDLYIRSNNSISLIEILDVNGKQLISEKPSDILSTRIDVSGLAEGMYFVKIYDVHGATALSKIIK